MTISYTLYIEAYTPETIPMARLAEYMQNLASLLGHESAVHFQTLKPGSTQIVTRVDHEDAPKVATHLEEVRRGEGSAEANRARAEIDRLLAEDNAIGFVYEDDDEKARIISFPGVTRPKPTTFGPFNQEGSLDGILISVGGADETAHIQLQNGEIKYTGIQTHRETARRLAKHMYEPVRLFGTGRWLRDADGNWILRSFKVRQDFAVLESGSLKDAVDHMREIEGSDWKNMDDPISALKNLREKGSGFH